MPRWWKIGFVSVLLITAGALSAHYSLKDPLPTGEHEAMVAEYGEGNDLDWDWVEGGDCQIYKQCQFIEVSDTHNCPAQIFIDMHIEDANEQWVAGASTVLPSPRKSGGHLVEIGVNREDFEYFAVGNIRCTAALPTAESEL